MEKLIGHIPPQSLEAEQSVIGSMIMDAEAVDVAREILSEEDFYHPDLRIIYVAIGALAISNQPVDFVTLKSKLEDEKVLDQIGGSEHLSKLALAVPTSTHVKQYATIVKEKSTLRKVIKASQESMADAYDGKQEIDQVLNNAEERIFNIIQKRDTDAFKSTAELINPMLNQLEFLSKNKGKITGVPTGFVDLDHMTTGFHPSDLILIAARPSMGKTALALNIIQYAAVTEKKVCAMFSLEMSKEQLLTRMVCSEATVDAQKVRTGNLAEADWHKISMGSVILAEAPIYIDDSSGITIAEIRAKCRKLKLSKGLDLIMIDYLQLMGGSGKARSREQEISEISRGLKAIAREMEAPVIALSQLSRACEARADHRPMLSDLRESGAIEQDADVVMFLYRDEYYHPDTEQKNQGELIIAKQRNGPTGTVDLVWIQQYTKFKSMVR